MNELHIITPMKRFDNFYKLEMMLWEQRVKHWELLMTPDELRDLDHPSKEIHSGWLTIHQVDTDKGNNPSLYLINEFVSKGGFIAEDWYQILCDDDWLEPGYVKKIVQPHASPILVVNMLRGNNPEFRGIHPNWELIADPQSMHYGHVGAEQGVFKGWVLNQVAREGISPNAPNEDILFKAIKSFPADYLPDVHVWFNYLEPGRWKV